jgi:hypothetical protein
MMTKDATQKHRNVQAAVNALALKDKRPMRSIRNDIFRFSATPSPSRVVLPKMRYRRFVQGESIV